MIYEILRDHDPIFHDDSCEHDRHHDERVDFHRFFIYLMRTSLFLEEI